MAYRPNIDVARSRYCDCTRKIDFSSYCLKCSLIAKQLSIASRSMFFMIFTPRNVSAGERLRDNYGSSTASYRPSANSARNLQPLVLAPVLLARRKVKQKSVLKRNIFVFPVSARYAVVPGLHVRFEK